MQELKRSDEKYIEIENFKDYELTPCIAYEMAIRNDEYIKAAQEAVKFYHEHEDLINSYFSDNINYGDFKNDDELMRHLKNQHEAYNIFLDQLQKIRLFDEKNGPIIHDKIDMISNDLKNIFDKIFNKSYPSKKNLLFNKDKSYHCYKDNVLDTVNISKNTNIPGFGILNLVSINDEAIYKLDEQGNETPEPKSIDEIQRLLKDEDLIEVLDGNTYIESNFIRPVLYSDPLKRRKAMLEIDLSLPTNELVSLIKHIKKHIDEDPKIVAAPIELLGESLDAADYEVCMDEGNCFDTRRYLSKQHKIADMFFIYDATKAGLKTQRIINELYKHEIGQADDISNLTPMDRKTLKKYLKIATEYIDNERYKELIDGVKS